MRRKFGKLDGGSLSTQDFTGPTLPQRPVAGEPESSGFKSWPNGGITKIEHSNEGG